jgi:hypothetical protein
MIDGNELTALGFVCDSHIKYHKEIDVEYGKIVVTIYCASERIVLDTDENNESNSFVLPYCATTENIERLVYALSGEKEDAKHTKDGIYIEKTAIYLRQANGWSGTAGLYRLDKPIQYIKYSLDGNAEKNIICKTNYIVVSDCSLRNGTNRLRVFPTDKNGAPIDTHVLMIVLGNTDHEKALNALGYTLVE